MSGISPTYVDGLELRISEQAEEIVRLREQLKESQQKHTNLEEAFLQSRVTAGGMVACRDAIINELRAEVQRLSCHVFLSSEQGHEEREVEEHDGCPRELAVLQRFWRNTKQNIENQKVEVKDHAGDWWRGYQAALHWISRDAFNANVVDILVPDDKDGMRYPDESDLIGGATDYLQSTNNVKPVAWVRVTHAVPGCKPQLSFSTEQPRITQTETDYIRPLIYGDVMDDTIQKENSK